MSLHSAQFLDRSQSHLETSGGAGVRCQRVIVIGNSRLGQGLSITSRHRGDGTTFVRMPEAIRGLFHE